MTNRKTIERLKAVRNYLCAGNPIWDVNEMRDVFDMAISALLALDKIYAFIMQSEASETTDGVLEIFDELQEQDATNTEKAQQTCNQLAKDTNVPCKDVISRQKAIDALCNGKCKEEGRWCDDGDCQPVRRLKALPSAQPTLYGYKIEHLAYIATVMQKEGITADKAVEIFSDIACVVTMLIEEIQNIVDKEMERCAT